MGYLEVRGGGPGDFSAFGLLPRQPWAPQASGGVSGANVETTLDGALGKRLSFLAAAASDSTSMDMKHGW